MAGTQYSGYKRQNVRVNATADATQTVIAAVPTDSYIVVIGYAVTVVSGATFGTSTLQDTAGSPAVFAAFATSAANQSVPVVYAGTEDAPAFELAKGVGLVVNNAPAVDMTGHLTYIVVK